jgi:hypothetical protein
MLPTKFVPILQSNFKGVIKLQMVPVLDILQFSYSIYGIKYITDSIIQSIYTNPSNETFFNSLDKELFIKHEISLIETERLLLYIRNILATKNSQSSELFQVLLPISNQKQIQIFLSYYQIYSISTFIEQFVNSYEIFRLKLITSIPEKPQPVNEEIIKPQPVNESASNSNSAEPEPRIEIEDQNSDMLSLFMDSFKISPNNICSYFISKQIYHNISNVQKTDPVTMNNDRVVIKIVPLINELIQTSNSQYYEITNILMSFNFSKEEYLSKLKLLIQQLTYIVTYYLESDEKETAKENVIFSLQIIHFLILIYSCKYVENIRFVNDQVNQAIQYIMMNFLDQSKFKYLQITFELLEQEEMIPFKKINDQLDNLLSRERYMMDIDRDLYIRNVMEKLDELDENSAVKKREIKLILNNPTTLNIEQLIKSNQDSAVKNNYLSYQILKPNQKQFESNTIITKEYYDILLLSTIPTLSRKTIESELNNIVTKYADIILNYIFKELSSSISDNNMIVSTLYLLEYHIRPFIKTEATIETELFLLYRVIIPYLYDLYGVKEFIDYFH